MPKVQNEILIMVLKHVFTLDAERLGALTVARLADSFHMSQATLYNMFKEEIDRLTPAQLVMGQKMYLAAAMLTDQPDLSVRDLGTMLGFANSNYFIRKFCQFFFITPGKFRSTACKDEPIR